MRHIFYHYFDMMLNAGTTAAILLAANTLPLLILAAGITGALWWMVFIGAALMPAFTILAILLIMGAR